MLPFAQPAPKVSIKDRPSARVAPVDSSSVMHLNIHVSALERGLLLAALLAGRAAGLSAQTRCPPATEAVLEAGWEAYRANAIDRAMGEFDRANRLCPANADAIVGLGFANLRRGRAIRADSLFRVVAERSPNNADAWEGRARAAVRLGDTVAAVEAGRRAIALAPSNRELRDFLDRVAPEWSRPTSPRTRPATLQIVARTRGRQFEVATTSGWRPFYVRGVNLGVALPGRYPSDFPMDSTQYAGWLDTLATMHANTLRVYTILPPAFYRALRGWNVSHPQQALWLIHGVWAELPPKHDFNDRAWQAEFQAEMRRVVDVVHGSASIPMRAGHAGGRFDADVSPWVLAYIIGREWEPFAVKAFNAAHPIGSFQGRYFQVSRAPAMDLWLVEQCDLMLRREAEAYNALRPIAYTSWPTLDPLHHPSEATTAEEAAWRKRSGRRSEAKKLEYENDAVSLDPSLARPTSGNPAGWFASYHAYPYYPDFMLLEPGYQRARSAEGPSSYFGYLRALVEYHDATPTLISEYGVPSSRGIAHLHPQGWNHGGHDERSMARIDARLTREIRESGAAGSILFAWMDEWFKKNWAVIDYELPADNTRLWHNVMDAEQNYGILGEYAGRETSTPRLGGDPEPWRALPLLQRVDIAAPWAPRALRIGYNESFVFISAELPAGKFPWDSLSIQLAIDTYLPKVGQHRLPGSVAHSDLGFEFLVELAGPERGFLRVIPDYNRHDTRLDPATGDDFGRFARRPVTTRNREDGRFDSLAIVTNRARFGRDGTFYRARGYDRGRLRYGTESASTLADWFLDERAGLLELRIPWDLLNVTDPSSRTLLFDDRISGTFGTAEAKDFHFGILTHGKWDQHRVIGALPVLSRGNWRADGFKPWRWSGWSAPTSHSHLKPVFDSLRLLWEEAHDAGPALLSPKAPSN
jgi:tetratricopeptide (TPR) repeat protein